VWVDVEAPDWERIEEIVEDAWRCVAGKRLVEELDAKT
jgi:hypothetical protein